MAADNVNSAEPLGGPIGLARRTIHVSFANGVTPEAPTDDTAFDVSRWALVPDDESTAPRYTPTIESVVADDDGLGATITADQELTPGIVYGAICTGVTGITDNGVDNVAAFVALSITSAPRSRSFRFLDMLPPINADEDAGEDEARFIGSLQEASDLLFDYADRWIEIFDADLAPENFLDNILADLGNPFVFPEALSVVEKRKLCQLLVKIYKLKGSIPGMQAVILFFLGLQSEFIAYDGLGSLLGDALSVGDAELGQAAGNSPNQFFLGAGGPYQFIAKLGTLVPEAGSPATALQVDRALRIIRIMKPVGFELLDILAGFIQSGARHSKRNSIEKTAFTGVVNLIMEAIENSDTHVFFVSNQPGVQQFNTQAELATLVSGSVAVTSGYDTLGNDLYFNGVGKNVGDDTRGLLFNELTNALDKTVLTATAGARKITLTWDSVAGATSYRIYRSAASFTSPTTADNADAPIEVSGDLAEYVDRLESGTTRYYRITPVIGANTTAAARLAYDAEGFFSDVASATST
jgi:phage tail-like protein